MQRNISKRKTIKGVYNFGKPSIKNVDKFKYNISHSGIWVVIAISSYEIGVDIEEISNRREILSNLELLFSKREIEYLRLKSKQNMMERFAQFWTVKESYLKHKGVGLFRELDSFSVIDSGEDRFIKGVISKRVFDNYYLSVFSEHERDIIEIRVDSADYKDFVERYKQYMMKNYDNKICRVS